MFLLFSSIVIDKKIKDSLLAIIEPIKKDIIGFIPFIVLRGINLACTYIGSKEVANYKIQCN